MVLMMIMIMESAIDETSLSPGDVCSVCKTSQGKVYHVELESQMCFYNLVSFATLHLF